MGGPTPDGAAQPDIAAAMSHLERSLARCLPAGTARLHDAASLQPTERYWLVHEGPRLVAALPQLGDLAALPSLDAMRGRIAAGAAPDKAMGVVAIGIAISAAPAWLATPSGESARLVLVNRRSKDIVLPVDPGGGAVGRVIKLPRGEPATRDCEREHALLGELAQAGMRLGPAPLARDEAGAAFHQEFVAGAPPRDLSIATLVRWPALLAGEAMTTPVDEARRLRERIATMALPDDIAAGLAVMLDRVADRTEVASGAVHGDFHFGNLVRGPDQDVRAIDWEHCSRDGIGFVDLIRLCYSKHGATARSLPELVSGRIGERMRRFHDVAFPAGRPRLEDLIYLTFCRYYLDRADAFGHESPYIRYLGGLVRDPTPL